MTRAWIGGVALLALAVTGCKRIDDTTPAPAASAAIKSIYAMSACPPSTGAVIGVVNIVVPDNFDGNKIKRSVNSLKANNPDPKNPKPDPQGSKPNQPTITSEPFDVFMDTDSGFGTGDKGLVLVRVILLNGKPNQPRWQFHTEGAFQGVGLTDPANADVLCGTMETFDVPSTSPNPPQGDAREIASFYINLDKFDWSNGDFEVPFVIGIELPEYSENPFLIDPKIRNGDGGGGIRT